MSYPDPIPELKRQLGAELAQRVSRFQADDVASVLQTDRARIGDLRRGNLTRFSLETLLRYAVRLGYRVELTAVKPRFNDHLR